MFDGPVTCGGSPASTVRDFAAQRRRGVKSLQCAVDKLVVEWLLAACPPASHLSLPVVPWEWTHRRVSVSLAWELPDHPAAAAASQEGSLFLSSWGCLFSGFECFHSRGKVDLTPKSSLGLGLRTPF